MWEEAPGASSPVRASSGTVVAVPAPLALLLGLTAGATLAWLAPPGAPDADPTSARAARALGALVLGPAAGYLEWTSDAWANLYLFDAPSAVDLLLVAAVAAAPAAGEALGRLALSRGDPRAAVALLGSLVTILAAAAVLARDRIAVVASYGAFHRGLGGDALLEHHAGAALAGALAATAAGVAVAARQTLRRTSH